MPGYRSASDPNGRLAAAKEGYKSLDTWSLIVIAYCDFYFLESGNIPLLESIW
jgi:hypothetical protein